MILKVISFNCPPVCLIAWTRAAYSYAVLIIKSENVWNESTRLTIFNRRVYRNPSFYAL